MKKRIISAGLVATLALAIFLNFDITRNMATVQATDNNYISFDINHSLDANSGIVKKETYLPIGSEQNPFTVLEIVPNKSMAKIGYLIPGCEPIDMDKMEEDFATNGSLYGTFQSNFLQQGNEIFSKEESYIYKFKDQLASMDGWQLVNQTLSETGYYEKLEDQSGNFNLNADGDGFEYVNANGDYQWVESSIPDGVDVDAPDFTADRVYMNREENSCYQKKECTLINNDWLIQDVFEMKSEEFKSQVITVTPDELSDASGNITEAARYWIDYADMIVIGGDREAGISNLWRNYNRLGIDKDDSYFNDLPTVLNKNGGSEKENDISWSVAYEILKREAGKVTDADGNRISPAATVMDQAAMMPSSSASENNFQKLFIGLVQYDPTAFWNLFASDIVDGSYNGKTAWDQSTFLLEKYGTGAMTNKYLPVNPIVTSYIYAYNGDNIFSHRLVSKDAISINSQGDVSELFEYLNRDNTGSEQIKQASPYEAINFILKQKEYKSKLNILELESCNSFYADDADWETFLTLTIPWFTGDYEKDITVTKMATYEFNANITDINAKYDLIIIGDKQTAANGGNAYLTTGSDDPHGSWDTAKQIYTNVGGAVVSNAKHNSRFDENDITEKKKNELLRYMEGGKPILVVGGLYNAWQVSQQNGKYTNIGINTAKVDTATEIYELAHLDFLKQYKNADGEWLYKFDRDDTTPPLFIGCNYNHTALKRAISEENCKIIFNDENSYPVEYRAIMSSDKSDSVITDVEYQPRNPDGSSVFTYRFTLDGNEKYTYSVHAYIDQNGDGVYENSRSELDKLSAIGGTVGTGEELANVTVVNTLTGETIATNALQANTNYTVSCRLPDDFQGILPWKLEVQANENSSVRDSVIKYSAVESRNGDRVKINVLEMNLTPDMSKNIEDSWGKGSNDDKSGFFINFTSGTVGTKFKNYLDCVKDFDVDIEYENNSEWYKKYGPGAKGTDGQTLTDEQRLSAWKAELDSYDMLILGFNDMCTFTSDDVFYEGFVYFKEQGKSIIMSHDMILATDSIIGSEEDAFAAHRGTLRNLYCTHESDLRTLVGQRKRYRDASGNWSYTQTVSNGKAVNLLPDAATYDTTRYKINGKSVFYSTIDGTTVSEYPDNANYLHSYSDYVTYDGRNISTRSQTTDREVTLSNNPGTNWSAIFATNRVGVANMGQITEYPYKINSVINVANTHTQYYSLDLEAFDDGDVVVWYNLTDTHSSRYYATGDDKGYYSSREGDGANNYYIYNKGNITYTGLGHDVGMTDDEIKLFVNTMIASYRYTASNPAIQVTNEDVVITNSNENVLYVTMDKLNIFSDESEVLPVTFKVLDEADLIKVTNRTYTLQFVDANGNPLANAPQVMNLSGQPLAVGANGYAVEKDGNYMFNVSFKDIRDNGSAVYYLKLTSTYVNSKNKVITTETTRKVSVLPLGLFDLD